MKCENYFLGLDIGTDSVGYAVTDKDYSLLKFRGEPMWGVHVFEEGQNAEARRKHRTARRRLQRRKQRVLWVRELFAESIAAVDPRFITRLEESGLFRKSKFKPEDLPDGTACALAEDEHVIFNDPRYKDKDYYRAYPTIHHLIKAQIEGDPKALEDVRLVYVSCAWLVAHRGHFLSDVDKNNVAEVFDFSEHYCRLTEWFEGELPWGVSAEEFADKLKQRGGVDYKKTEFAELLFGGKFPKATVDDKVSCEDLIKLLCGSESVKLSKLFCNEEYTELEGEDKISLTMDDETMVGRLSLIDDDHAELIRILKNMYDWSKLVDILDSEKYISFAKVKQYEKHKDDLRKLKDLTAPYGRVGEHGSPEYVRYFKSLKEDDNYAAYIKKTDKFDPKKFLKATKSLIESVKPVGAEHKALKQELLKRIESGRFLPKQVNGDNRVIPYQLYWQEMYQVLENASAYHPFLNRVEDGCSTKEKLLSIMEFKVPYFVGPLVSDERSSYAWMARRAGAEGRILPWNFDEKVDLEESEDRFIGKLVGRCTYLPEEGVLPKQSLLYSSFETLNELNNLKVNGEKLTVEEKQEIYTEVFLKKDKVTPKDIESKLKKMRNVSEVLLSGFDEKLKSSLKSYRVFEKLRFCGELTDVDAEKIIARSTYAEDKSRFKLWLDKEYSSLSAEDRRYLSGKSFKDFGRLSRTLLLELVGRNIESGEEATVIEFMWSTDDNFMQIVESDRYSFKAQIEKIRESYYSNKGLESRLDELYVSNKVKRIIYRTLDVVGDVVKAKGAYPEKIFIEMARDVSEPKEKRKRTKSRKDMILELYKKSVNEDIPALKRELEEMGETADDKLRREALFLYYTQFGRCMYTGERIDLQDLLAGKTYNVDHIYPRAFVKDDSLANKVLVLSTVNGEKGDNYPIAAATRGKMAGYWSKLHKMGAISDEKYRRLTRATEFSDEERWRFINRQLVDTRQSTKAVASLLKDMCPNTRIEYVKAGLVSEFRNEVLEVNKCRSVNDLHHAKDAYLNIVVGNVYNAVFSDKWFRSRDRSNSYSIKSKTVFDRPRTVGGVAVWGGGESIDKVRKCLKGNAVHFTRFAFVKGSGQSGGFFNVNPEVKKEGLHPRKAGLPSQLYGGYNNNTTACYVLVCYTAKKKRDAIFMPVDLLDKDKFFSDDDFAREYARKTVEEIVNGEVEDISFLLNKRMLRINTVLELDGVRYCIAGKDSGGKNILLKLQTPAILSEEMEEVIKNAEKFGEKHPPSKDKGGNAKRVILDPKHDGFSEEDLATVYGSYVDKLSRPPFDKMPANPVEKLKKGRKNFDGLSIEEKCAVIKNVASLTKTGRAGAVDLSLIGGSPSMALLRIGAKLGNMKKNYKRVVIADFSSSGLFEHVSNVNLLDLI